MLSPSQLHSTSAVGGSGDAVNVQRDGAIAGDQRISSVIHYKVELPPCFHGDGKDKDSFSLWKARLELAVRACPASRQSDLATILPTRLSGDALAFWLSLPSATQADYDTCISRLTDVFGGKQFLQHFQTFVNARQRLPKEPLEVFAAEITRLVFEAFPGYGQPAIAMERFRRFVAGLDPVLQVKCHEHGATTLEEALAVACKCERAQEALRLAQPQCVGVLPPASCSSSSQQAAHITAMVSSTPAPSGDVNPEILSAIKQLSAEVQTLRLSVTDWNHRRSSPASPGEFRQRQRSPESSSLRQGRAVSRFSPHASPHRRRQDAGSSQRFSSEGEGYTYRHQSPDPRGRRYTSSPPSSPCPGLRQPSNSRDNDWQQNPDYRRRDNSSPYRPYSSRDDYRRRQSPDYDRYGRSSPHDASSGRDDYQHQRSPDFRRHGGSSPLRPAQTESWGYPRGPSLRREYSPAGAKSRREPSHDRHHVSFNPEDRELQGNEW